MFRSARYIFVLLLVLAACAGSLIFCMNFRESVGGTGKYVPIFSGKRFAENELIQIELAFADAKLSDYVISDGTVQVPKRQKTVFIQALKKIDFLTQETVESQTSSGGLFVSEKEREAAALRDKQATLAAQIRTFHGIESARILLDVSETKVGFTREKHSSAAVSIRSRAGYSVTQEDIQSILLLVTCSVCGLNPANVTIVDTRTNQSWRFDAPKIEVIPESPVENDSSGSKSVNPNRSRKIVLQAEPLPQPELWNSSSREILQTSAEEPVFEFSANSTSLGQISFNSHSPIPQKEVLSELSSSGNDSTSIFSKSFGKLKLSEAKTSNQHPRQVVILLGVLAAPVILICGWIIFVTRKGIFRSDSNRMTRREKDSQEKFEEKPAERTFSSSSSDLMNELVSEIASEVSAESDFLEEPNQESNREPNHESNQESNRESEANVEVEPETEQKPVHIVFPEIVTLEQVAPERLALAFLEERPQTAAMILARLNPTIANAVLANIPAKLRQGIEVRMTGSCDPDEEILREAAQAILEHLDELDGVTAENDDFLQTAEAILKGRTIQQTEKNEKKVIRPLADVIPKERIVNRFEDLKSCSDGELRGILRATSVQDVNLALLGAEPELVNRVLDVLPKPAAKELRFQLTHPGKIHLMEVEEARQRMVEHAGV